MENTVIISKSSEEELERVAETKKPNFSTERGDLFLAEDIGMAAIRLKVPIKDYFAFISSQPKNLRPKAYQLASSSSKSFHIAVTAPVYMENGVPHIDGKEVSLI